MLINICRLFVISFTKPGVYRTAIVTTLTKLQSALQQLLKSKVQVEHIYDY